MTLTLSLVRCSDRTPNTTIGEWYERPLSVSALHVSVCVFCILYSLTVFYPFAYYLSFVFALIFIFQVSQRTAELLTTSLVACLSSCSVVD